MGIVLKAVRYLVALALFVGGAYVLAIYVGAAVVEAGKADQPAVFLDLLKRGLSVEPQWWLGIGLGSVAVALLLARPIATVYIGGRERRQRKKSLQDLVDETGHPDQRVRLEAVTALAQIGNPQTIPALVRALRDATTKVRGQACEALENMTGLTFDFVDIAPKSAREKAVAGWVAWWREHQEEIRAGKDPRSIGRGGPAGEPGGVFETASAVGFLDEAPEEAPHEAAPAVEEAPVVGEVQPAGSPPGRVSLGDYIRKKRERAEAERAEATEAAAGDDDEIVFAPPDDIKT